MEKKWGQILFQEFWAAFLSPFAPLRRMAFLFFISFSIAFFSLFCLGLAVWQHYRSYAVISHRKQKQAEEEYAEKLNQLSAPLHRYLSEITLGEFRIDIKSKHTTTEYGTKDMALLEIVVLCNSPVTRKWVEAHLEVVRNELFQFFSLMDREEFLTQEGKLRFKNMIIKRLNAILPEGSIEQVYFPNMVLS